MLDEFSFGVHITVKVDVMSRRNVIPKENSGITVIIWLIMNSFDSLHKLFMLSSMINENSGV